MQIRVKLFALLKDYAPNPGLSGAPFDLELPEGSTLDRLVAMLALPAELVRVAFVNGIIRPPDWVLQPGDEVGVFPPVGGGAR